MMAEESAPEIKPEQVMAAIGDRTKKMELIAAKRAAGPHPISEGCLTSLHNRKAAISAQIDDLNVVLDGANRGDLAFMEVIPPTRLDKLLAGRLRGVTPKNRRLIESCNLALSRALKSTMPASSAPAVLAAPDAPPSASGQAAASSEDLARLQISPSDEFP